MCSIYFYMWEMWNLVTTIKCGVHLNKKEKLKGGENVRLFPNNKCARRSTNNNTT